MSMEALLLTQGHSLHSHFTLVADIVVITEALVRMPTAPSMIMLWLLSQLIQLQENQIAYKHLYLDNVDSEIQYNYSNVCKLSCLACYPIWLLVATSPGWCCPTVHLYWLLTARQVPQLRGAPQIACRTTTIDHLIRKQLIVDEMSFLKGSNHIKNDTYEKIYPYQTLREHTKQCQKTFKKYQMPI